jgi:hypothetical protein
MSEQYNEIYHRLPYGSLSCQRLEDRFHNICYNSIKEYELKASIITKRGAYKHYSAFIKNPNSRAE